MAYPKLGNYERFALRCYATCALRPNDVAKKAIFIYTGLGFTKPYPQDFYRATENLLNQGLIFVEYAEEVGIKVHRYYRATEAGHNFIQVLLALEGAIDKTIKELPESKYNKVSVRGFYGKEG